jgi:putative phosphoesterase
MKIGVISDTHLRQYDERLRRIVDEYFRDVEIIMHAGDLVALEVLDVFAGKEVKAVCGNMDGADIRDRLSDKMLIEMGGFRIGLIHGWGMPFGLEKKLRKQFDHIDCLVYGHTHHACNKLKDGVLYFNPGSAMDKRFAKKNTIGILEIGDAITGRIIEISV